MGKNGGHVATEHFSDIQGNNGGHINATRYLVLFKFFLNYLHRERDEDWDPWRVL
jgi:hypothetical protein